MEKVPQPHGGALLAGGMPGNKGGGRPSDELKAKMARLSNDVAEELAKRLASDPGSFTAADLASIMDKGAKYNLTTGVDLTTAGQPLQKTYIVIDPETDV